MTILSAILGLQLIILVHELGHFLAARLVRLPVERLSIGFPPFIFRTRRNGIEYCIGAIPLGGFVKVDLGTSGESRREDGLPRPWTARLFTVLAGPMANLMLAILILFVIFAFVGQEIAVYSNIVGNADNGLGLAPGDTIIAVNGIPTPGYEEVSTEMRRMPEGTITAGTSAGRAEITYAMASDQTPGFLPLIPPVIGESILGMPAYEAGLRQGDSLVAVNGRSMGSWIDLLEEVSAGGDSLSVAFVREGSEMTVVLEPMTVDGHRMIGVVAATTTTRMTYPVPKAIGYSVTAALDGVVGIFGSILSAFSRPGEFVEMSGGPVYIAETLNQQAGIGLGRFLDTMAALSIAIMCFNLLPIPILDGGHAVFLLYEGIAGKPVSRKGITLAQNIGMLMLLLLLGLILWKDLSRVFLRVRL